jgi:hypothetical protein
MAVREATNRIRIEGFRLSRVPINPATTIYQGDLVYWSAGGQFAGPAVSGDVTSGASFLGVSDTTNPIETLGSHTFLNDSQSARINVVQNGLVEMLCEATHTWYPFDPVYQGITDAQSVKHSGSNIIGYVDPGVGASGKSCVAGDTIKFWLEVADKYRAL